MVFHWIWIGEHDRVKDLFLAGLPMASAVVSYWFANFKQEKDRLTDGVTGEG